MKRLAFRTVVFFSALLCVPLSGCNASHAADNWPRVLHYAYSPNAETLQGGGMRGDLMRAYLEKQLHIPVEVVLVQGYAPTIEAMRAEKVDIASIGGSLSYLIAAQKAGAEAIVARGNADGTLGGYHSVIAVPKNSPIHSLQDLKAHAKDIVFAFADPASTSGDLYPRVCLQQLGIDPDKDFKRLLYANGHLADLMAIMSGKVDAGAFDQVYMTRLIAKDKMKPDDLRILWTSELIPNEPIAVRKALPEKLKKEIQDAYLQMQTRDPALYASLSKNVYTSYPGSTYVPVTDATYDGLRHYAQQVKQFNFLEK